MVVLEAAVGVFLVLFGVVAVVLFIILCELLHVHAVVPQQCMPGHVGTIALTTKLSTCYNTKQELTVLRL